MFQNLDKCLKIDKVNFYNAIIYKEDWRLVNKLLVDNREQYFTFFSFVNHQIFKSYSRTNEKLKI